MKELKLTLLIFVAFRVSASAQDNKDLYYAQPQNTGLYLGFVYLSPKNFLLVGENSVFLFGEKRTIVDTLRLSKGSNTFLDNVNHMALIDSSTISISTLQRAFLIKIENNQLKLIRDLYNKELEKKLGKYDLFVLFNRGLIARSRDKDRSHFFHKQIDESSYSSTPSKNLTLPATSVTQYRGSEIIAFNKYQSLNDDIYLFRRKQNSLSKFNTLTKECKEIKLPKIDSKNQLHEFFVDPLSKKCYVFLLSADGKNAVFEMSTTDYSFKLIKRTEHIIRGIFNGKMYVTGVFDNTIAHYLLPLQGENESVIFIQK